jgi:hypothetical protein
MSPVTIPHASSAAAAHSGIIDSGPCPEPAARPPPDRGPAGGSRMRRDHLPRLLRSLLPHLRKSGKGKEADAGPASPHLRTAMQRAELLFGEKTPQDKRAAQAAAVRNIDFYLANNPGQPVDPRVRELLVLCDETVDDVQSHALPYGRPNVFVTNWDGIGGRSLRHPASPNADEMLARAYLSKIAREIDSGAEASGIEQRCQRFASASLFTGCMSCGGYADLFALALQQRCAELKLTEHETIRIDSAAWPRLNGKRVDHECCAVTYTRDNGRDPKVEATIICDPWAQMNTPILAQHSRLEGWTVRGSYDPKAFDAAATRGAIDAYLREADDLYASVRHSDTLRLRLSCLRFSLGLADSKKAYSIDDPFFGISRRQHLDFANPGVKLPRKRRPTHASARQSDLVRAALADPKSRDPRDVAHAMLECPADRNWFDRWTGGLDLPRESQALQGALTFRLEDGAGALGKAIELGRGDLLKSLGRVLKHGDRGGIGPEQWKDALLDRDANGDPALVRMLRAAQRPGTFVEGMAADTVRRFGKLLKALPETERQACLRAIFDAPGLPGILHKRIDLPCLDELIELLPAYEDGDDSKPAALDSRYRTALEQLRAEWSRPGAAHAGGAD